MQAERCMACDQERVTVRELKETTKQRQPLNRSRKENTKFVLERGSSACWRFWTGDVPQCSVAAVAMTSP